MVHLTKINTGDILGDVTVLGQPRLQANGLTVIDYTAPVYSQNTGNGRQVVGTERRVGTASLFLALSANERQYAHPHCG